MCSFIKVKLDSFCIIHLKALENELIVSSFFGLLVLFTKKEVMYHDYLIIAQTNQVFLKKRKTPNPLEHGIRLNIEKKPNYVTYLKLSDIEGKFVFFTRLYQFLFFHLLPFSFWFEQFIILMQFLKELIKTLKIYKVILVKMTLGQQIRIKITPHLFCAQLNVQGLITCILLLTR